MKLSGRVSIARRCGGFAAEGPAGRSYQSIAAQLVGSATLSADM